MRYKTILLAIFIALMPLATANILIEAPTQEADISDLQKSFQIGFMNTGDQTVNLTLSTNTETDITLQHKEKISLQPSQTTSTPQGENWYYLGDGEYAKINYVSLDTEIPLDTTTRSHDFDLSISRVHETGQNRPNVENIQELNFNVFSTSEKIQTGFQTTENPEQDNTSSEDNSENENVETEENTEPEQNDNSIQNSTNSTQPQSRKEKSDIDSITILLVLGIIIGVIWTLKEVLM